MCQNNFFFKKIYTNTYSNVNTLNIKLFTKNINVFALLLKTSLNNIFFNLDINAFNNLNTTQLVYANSCLLTNNKINIYISLLKTKNSILSISNIFKSTTWVERELQEFNNITFLFLRDSRRLLTDYTNDKNNYNKDNYYNNYNVITQDLYTRVLHWLFCFTYCLLIVCFSFIFYNRSLLHLLVLSEVLIILLTGIFTAISLFFNLYYLISFTIIILILGGLELSVNLLILTIKDKKFNKKIFKIKIF